VLSQSRAAAVTPVGHDAGDVDACQDSDDCWGNASCPPPPRRSP